MEARADQCQVLSTSQATSAQAVLRSASRIAYLCEPCGERLGPSTRITAVGNVEMRPWSGGGGQWEVYVDGAGIDLAYVFTSSDGVHFTNLSRVAGCEATGVSERFTIGAPVAPPPVRMPPVTPEVTVGATLTAGAPSTTWRRPVGVVRLALTSVLIAPGKSSGMPWDGPGQLPQDTQRALRAGLSGETFRAIFSAFVESGTGMGAATRFAPWALNALNSATAAPDALVDVTINGERVARAQNRTHTFTPSWGSAYSRPVQIGPNQHIELEAWDTDVMFNDPIGTCTIQGMPLVDRNGYARAEDFTCTGQLWGVRLRVIADSYEPVASANVPMAPPPSAVAPPPQPGPVVAPAAIGPGVVPAAPGVRRGGAGESCTRTDDCEAPLRCIRHECAAPTE